MFDKKKDYLKEWYGTGDTDNMKVVVSNMPQEFLKKRRDGSGMGIGNRILGRGCPQEEPADDIDNPSWKDSAPEFELPPEPEQEEPEQEEPEQDFKEKYQKELEDIKSSLSGIQTMLLGIMEKFEGRKDDRE